MNTINLIYNKLCNTPSDINEHLSVLSEYSSKCEHVTEFGARYGCSTFALLNGRPNKFISYDLNSNSNIEQAIELSKIEGIDFTFKIGNVLKLEIEETDLLFIDTLHRYGQLKEELRLHANKVKKYLIFHDTESFEFKDEPNYYGNTLPITTNTGLWPAIEEFLNENSNWLLLKRYKNNNGLTILEKIK